MALEPKSSEELKRASWRVLYEYAMLLATSATLNREQPRATVLENALVESFGVHARGLIEFFSNHEGPKGTDIKAHDYRFVQRWSAPKTYKLDGVRERVSKQIAHLTYARLEVEPGEGLWHTEKIVQPIRKWVQGFREAVAPDLLHPAWATFDGEQFVEGVLRTLHGGYILVGRRPSPASVSSMPKGVASYTQPHNDDGSEG